MQHRKVKTKILLTLGMALALGAGQAQNVPFSDRYAVIGDLNVHYKIGGSGPALLLLHGFTLTHDQWLPIAEELAKDHTLIIPDLPGHGGSDMPKGRYSFEKAADIMLGLLEHLKIDRLKGIGHSGGAVTLMLMATQDDNLLESMILVGGAHRVNEDVRTFLRNDSFELSGKAFQDYYLSIHPGGLPQIKAIFKAENEIAEKAFFLSKETLSNFSIPVLLVWGDRDDLMTLDVGIELYHSLPNAQLWVIPGQGHTPIWPQLGGDAYAAAQFTPVVRRFFRQMVETSMLSE